jgi:YD repeat-containing protein
MSGMYAFDWGSLGGGNYEFQYVALDGNGQILNQQSGTFNTSNPNAPSVSAQTPLAIGGPGRAFVSNSGINGMGSGLQLINQGADAASVEMRYRLKNSNGDWLTPGTSFAANNSFGIGSFVLDPAGLSGMVNGNQYDVQFIIKNSSGTVLRTATGTITKDTSGLNISPLQVAPKLTFTQPTTAKTLDIRYRLVNTGTYSLPIRLTTIGNGQFEWDPTSLISNFSNTYDYDFDIQAQDADGMLVNHNQVNVRLGATTSQLSSQIIALPQVLRIKPTQTGINYMQLSYRVKGSSTDYSFLNNKVTASTNDDGSKEYRFELPATLTAGDYEYRYTAYAADTVDANGDPVQTALGSSTGYFTAGTNGSASRLDWVIATNGNVNSPSPKISRSQSYNAFGDIVTETDGRGNVTSYTYNTLGAMTKKVAPKVSITAENGAVNANATPTTEYTYDALGRVIAVKDANGNLNTQVWRAGSTEEGNITLEKHADGGIKAAGFDIFGNKRTEYDELATSRTTSAADATHRTDYTYDKENRLTKVEHQARNADGSGRSVDQYSYDAVGNRISHTNADNNTEKTTYDSLGRVTKTTSFMGFDTSYAYTYLNNLTGVGGATVGGWQKVTIDTVGRTLTDKLDMFNHLTWHEDLGGHQFTYSYNQAGWLMSQTGTSGQNIAYSYYNNGYIQSIQDKAVGMYTYYQYDDDGNKTFEGYISLKDAQNFAAGAKDYYQYATITYDAMNRMTSVVDPKAAISYEYDAVGNRRMVHSEYYDGANGSRQIQEYWYKYDSMNRFLITMGTLNGTRSGTSTSISKGSTGVDITYNFLGQRTQAINGSDNTTEGYSYTNDGYLTDVKINGTLASRRSNDALGRVYTYQQFGSNASIKNTTYDKDNRVTQETGTDGTTNYYYYTDKNDNASTVDVAGRGGLARTKNDSDGDGKDSTGTIVNTYYAYQYWDDAKQFAITNQGYNATLRGNNDLWKSGYSELKYDVNGHLAGAVDRSGNRSFRYVNDAQGLILFRDEIAGGTINRVQRYYYVDGKRIGDVGNDGDVRTDYVQAMAKRSQSKPDYKHWKPVSSADFDQNYEPISPSYPGFAASTYTVKNGDTLQSIARSVWGDGDMWYLIADANGLTNSNSLTAGQVLTIPNKVTNIHNNSGTYRVYNPGEAIGDVNPTLPTAPPVPRKKKGGCGGFAQLIVAAVAIAVTVATYGSLGAVASAALGNIAGQVTGNVLGVQKGFDFKSFATSVATAAVLDYTPVKDAIGKLAGTVGNAVGSNYAAVAARAVAGNVISQGVGNLTGSQKGFSWSSVAISSIGAAAGAAISDKLGYSTTDAQGITRPTDTKFGTDFGRAATTAGAFALTQLVVKGGKVNWTQVASDTVTNFIQNKAESEQIDQNAKLVKQQRLAQGNTSESDSATRLFKANQAYAEANQPIGGMTGIAPAQGGMALAAAAANATDEVIAAAYMKQQTDQTATMPLLFTSVPKEGGLAASNDFGKLQRGGLSLGWSTAQDERVVFNQSQYQTQTKLINSVSNQSVSLSSNAIREDLQSKVNGTESLKSGSFDLTTSLISMGNDASNFGDWIVGAEKTVLGLTKVEGLNVLQKAGELQKSNKIKVGGAFDLEYAKENIFKSPDGKTVQSLASNATKYSLVFKGFALAGNVATGVEETAFILRTPEGKRMQAFGSSVTNVVGDTGSTAGGMYLGAFLGALTGPAAPIAIPVLAAGLGYGGHKVWDESAKPFYRELWTGIPEPKK